MEESIPSLEPCSPTVWVREETKTVRGVSLFVDGMGHQISRGPCLPRHERAGDVQCCRTHTSPLRVRPPFVGSVPESESLFPETESWDPGTGRLGGRKSLYWMEGPPLVLPRRRRWIGSLTPSLWRHKGSGRGDGTGPSKYVCVGKR